MTDTHVCGCGCGQPTRLVRGHWSKFRPGHDLRLLTSMVKLVQSGDARLREAYDLIEQAYSTDLARRFLSLVERSQRARRRELAHKPRAKAGARRKGG